MASLDGSRLNTIDSTPTTTTKTISITGTTTTTTAITPTNDDKAIVGGASVVAVLPQQQVQATIVPIYQIMVTLFRSKPKTWRRVQLYSNSTLYMLHQIIQICMDWSDSHSYKFTNLSNKKCYTKQLELFHPKVCKLSEVLVNVHDTMKYVYDLSSAWNFEIELEAIIPPPPPSPPPTLLSVATATTTGTMTETNTSTDGNSTISSSTVQQPVKKKTKKSTVTKSIEVTTVRYPRIMKGRNIIVEYLSEDESDASQAQYIDVQYYQMELDRKFHP